MFSGLSDPIFLIVVKHMPCTGSSCCGVFCFYGGVPVAIISTRDGPGCSLVAKKTTGIASINKTQLSAFPVVIAPTEIQETFVDRVHAVEALALQQAAALATAQSAFASLLDRAFKA